MANTSSFSQKTRITKKSGAATVNQVDSADSRQQMIVDNAQYHAEKLGLGGHGTHEGWIKAEEAGAMVVSAETRQNMIAVAAYHLAEKRGFASQGEHNDWLKAEAEIDAMLHDHIGKS